MLQFPTPLPPGSEPPPMSSFEQFVTCVLLVMMVVFLGSMLLPRHWFVALFKIAFPFMPETLEDFHDKK
jgi:hypothetical protein